MALNAERDSINLDELLTVTITIDTYPDTIVLPAFKNFRVSAGPSETSNMTYEDGVRVYDKKWIYQLRALSTGNLSIECPMATTNGKQIPCEEKEVFVFKSSLSADEQHELKLESLKVDRVKPEGTQRITFYDDIGFIQIYESGQWYFERRLTKPEAKRLQFLNY